MSARLRSSPWWGPRPYYAPLSDLIFMAFGGADARRERERRQREFASCIGLSQ